MDQKTPHIVVLGAGFGGLTFCKSFRCDNARVTLVDRRNHHLFQALLYQVASAGLSAPDIAQPIRAILSKKKNVTVLMDEVVDFDLQNRRVVLKKSTLDYDFLVLALGGMTSYFGHPEWEQFAPGLKSLEDAVRIRREILLAFERAEDEADSARLQQRLAIVVIGGGPTGVELAGAFAELGRFVLRKDFRRIDPAKARVILIEGGPRVLPFLPEHLSAKAQQQLERLGVEVRTNTRVKNITRGCVELDGATIYADNVIWAAGLSAVPVTQKLGVPLDRAGRVIVKPDLSVPGHPEVFAIGDVAHVVDDKGKQVPGLAPAAMQMARHIAKTLAAELVKPGTTRKPFHYWDKGTLATIGRSKAVVKIGKIEFGGFLAWLTWLLVHLIFLVGFRNKISVLIQWAYSYFTYKRGARIITGVLDEGRRAPAAASPPKNVQ